MRHVAGDEHIRVAYLPDPIKLNHEPGYPSPSITHRLKDESGMKFELITVAELLHGCLEKRGYACLCIPGGFAPNTKNALGEKGKCIIEEFLRAGGGFIGICAGAYLGSTWGWSLLSVDIDLKHWDRYPFVRKIYINPILNLTLSLRRGNGPCALKFSKQGQEMLGAREGEVIVRYTNGPTFLNRGSSVEVSVGKTRVVSSTGIWRANPNHNRRSWRLSRRSSAGI